MAAVVVAVSIIGAEIAVRWMDGYPLMRLAIPPATAAPAEIVTGSSRDTADARHFSSVALAPAVDPQWYKHDPPPLARHPMTAALTARWERYGKTDGFGAFFAWTSRYLRAQLCAGARLGSLGILDDFYYFDPPTETVGPSYRHLSHISPPGWFPTNRFGWRGPEVALNKPPGTIRIAFVGSSMTIDPYGLPFSHIEFIGEWLNLWVRARGLAARWK